MRSPEDAINGHGTTHTQSPDRRASKRVRYFHEEDEHEKEQIGDLANGAATNGKQSKHKRALRAADLLSSRKLLPIWQGREGICQQILNNDTVVILGETGSGKTTQVPQFLLQASKQTLRIAVTQPRVVAATSLAARVADELGCKLGTLVGYTVRFDDISSNRTLIKYVTDGTLLQELLGDAPLSAYDVIIIDEAHERSLRSDMLMGFLKSIQSDRKEAHADGQVWQRGPRQGEPVSALRIVIMSATLDAQKFSAFFDNAPVLFVRGRQHTVLTRYTAEPVQDFVDAALKTIFQINLERPRGDILVFLTGQEDIESLKSSLEYYIETSPTVGRPNLIILPLYAQLPPKQTKEAFAPALPGTRKVILATNVAETSLTIPGVRYVIDTGMQKEKRHHAAQGLDSLLVEKISKSSAMQRAGRAGREEDGECFRLYTEEDYNALEASSLPEIKRVSLSFALLHLMASGSEDVYTFDFLDAPAVDSIKMAMLTLHALQAVSDEGKITPLGRKMAMLPLDPTESRILLAAFEHGCPSEIVDLLSLLSQYDSLLINSYAAREQATEARKVFLHRDGDHMMLLNILRAYVEVEDDQRASWCREHFINHKALQNVLRTQKQLRDRCVRLKLDWTVTCGESSEPVLLSCHAGLFHNVAIAHDDGQYRTVGSSRMVIKIHPSSTIHNRKVRAIMYQELVRPRYCCMHVG
ncbi:hypothetical protein E5Q_05925 [Mixia osmundae IAM 14324]|uniref:RNA helicase n=1 Tax=Mixia osmundae (strain CBS 9802 / IAM 14324 / JCM 22182 / KY 12970) TaxID=764103 RepID=G7E9B2_MIXOS|nr:hypothetical protein E5Q_05925 [Mixia osmundae IAM 14324]